MLIETALAVPTPTSQSLPSTMQGRSGRRDASYAASIRSDMTFPMRGDGGKAREVSAVPAVSLSSVAEINAPPPTIPYPGVLSLRQPKSSSSSNFSLRDEDEASRPSFDRMSSERSATRQQISQITAGAGNFFGGIKRRGSRRDNVHPSGFLGLAKTLTNERGTGAKGHVSTPSAPMIFPERVYSQDSFDTSAVADDDSSVQVSKPRTQPSAVSGPRSFGTGGGRAPSPSKGLQVNPFATVSGLSPPSAAGAMYASGSDASSYGSRSRGNSNSSSNAHMAGRESVHSSSLAYGSVLSDQSEQNHAAKFEQALDRVADVLPDADRHVLAGYLRKTGGDDLAAVSAYLQDQQGRARAR